MHKSECSKGDLNESGNRVKEKENRDVEKREMKRKCYDSEGESEIISH